MAASDVSALIDVASSPESSPAETEVVEETVDTEIEPSEETSSDQTEQDDTNASPDDTDEKNVDGRTNPAAIRSALKAFRDSDPKNAPIARELNNGYGRYTAYKSVFPKVSDAQNAKAALDAVGGGDGIAALQATIKSVNDTDSLLFAGDGKVIQNIWDDFKAEGKTENFGKLASPFLDTLRKNDADSYYSTMKPHFYQGLVETQFPDVLSSLTEALSGDQPNLPAAQKILANLGTWFNKLRDSVEAGAKANLDPDRQAFEAERTEFQTQKQKEFQSTVTTAWNSENNRALGTALKPYLKLPFAKNWTDGTKVSVAREITSTLINELSADKTYQAQMDAFWSKPKPDKDEIVRFHKSKVDILASRIVKKVLDDRYPGFKNVKLPMKKTGLPAPGAGAAAQPGAAVYVSTKPDGNDIDWKRDPNRLLFITGKAYLRNGRFVTWNIKNKK